MPYSARIVANYFIELKRKRDETPPTPMQLLKLIYIAHGWNLAVNDRPLITDRIEAWQYGPVIPNLYHAVKQWGNMPIRELLPTPATDEATFSPDDKKVMDVVLGAYGQLSGIRLSNLTHASGTPWRKVYIVEGGQYRESVQIADELIKQHFTELAGSLDNGR